MVLYLFLYLISPPQTLYLLDNESTPVCRGALPARHYPGLEIPFGPSVRTDTKRPWPTRGAYLSVTVDRRHFWAILGLVMQSVIQKTLCNDWLILGLVQYLIVNCPLQLGSSEVAKVKCEAEVQLSFSPSKCQSSSATRSINYCLFVDCTSVFLLWLVK